jgi:2-oxoglutarate ferredoxin oxidoreductase subunit beta
MPSVATGANMANGDMIYLGVSGDGDSASIGMGQFVHAIRRNINMVYILMNNGCYGLTKGQDSATADKGSRSKKGTPSRFSAIDMASLTLELGGTFVAQSFSGDKSQLVPLIKAAINHNGFAFINVVSPCVTFNNNLESTKSYDYFREHAEATSSLDYVPEKEQIAAKYKEGSQKTITLHDGSKIYLDKLAKDWDPTDFDSARTAFMNAKKSGNIPTGLIYLDPESIDLHEILNTSSVPLNQLDQNTLCPGSATLEKINASLR